MRVLQKNKGCRSYLEISGIGKQDSFACRMIVNNRFESIPECEYRIIDNDKMLLYKIDGLSSVSVKFGRVSPEIKDVIKLMRDLSYALTEIEDYMLNPDDLLIEIRSIMYDSIAGRYRFLYVPESGGGFIKQVKTLLEDIMVIYDHDDREGTVKLYDLYSSILPDNFTPEMFKQLIKGSSEMHENRQFNRTDINEAAPENIKPDYGRSEESFSYKDNTDEDDAKKKIYITGGAVAVLGITATVLLGVKGIILSILMVAVYMIYAINSYRTLSEEIEIRNNLLKASGSAGLYMLSETAPYNDNELMKREIKTDGYRDQKTDDQKKCISRLVPFISEKEIPIELTDNSEIRIGRQTGVNEYCLTEPGISRLHAVITKKGTRVCLRDEGSTNGTYVNNRRISGGETELKYGDVVSFAGVEYYCV